MVLNCPFFVFVSREQGLMMKWLALAAFLVLATGEDFIEPSVFVVILARNKGEVLPYFLSLFDRLEYPKNRMSLWIRSDHCEDDTGRVLQVWVNSRSHLYHSVNFRHSAAPAYYTDEASAADWSKDRFKNIVRLKQEALSEAKKAWADYVWFTDVDVLIANPKTLIDLIAAQKPIIAPLLKSFGRYSNFWGAMTEDYYYTRSDDYVELLDRKKLGIFPVPLVHSCVLVDLRRKTSVKLSYDPAVFSDGDSIPYDDIIAFAISANRTGAGMWITNVEQYGVIPLVADVDRSPEEESDMLLYLKLLATELTGEPLPVQPDFGNLLEGKDAAKSLPGTSKTYLINLERRPERRRRMEYCFQALGIEAEWIRAVDGASLTVDFLKKHDIHPYAEFRDPHGLRPIKYGEVGCFLSHYGIWQDIVANGYEVAAVFEDDIHFEMSFMAKVRYALWEAKDLGLEWDLMYLGRKILRSNETWVPGARTLVYPDYTYWTLSYLITLDGARKLLTPDPLKTLLPVDEYLPIMFDKHPNATLSGLFPMRSLKAVAVNPMAVNPTHYTGQPGYVSDTEGTKTALNDAEPAIGMVTVNTTAKPDEDWNGNVYSYSQPAVQHVSYQSSYQKRKLSDEL